MDPKKKGKSGKHHSLFKKKTKTSVEEMQTRLAQKIEDLTKKSDYLERQQAMEAKNAVMAMKEGNKKRAIECLKRKKILEKRSMDIGNIILNLEQQKSQMESAILDAAVLVDLKESSKVIQSQLRKSGIKDAESILDDIEETNEAAGELKDAISRPLGPILDENELEDELGALVGKNKEEEEKKPGPLEKAITVDEDEQITKQLMAPFA